MLNHEKVNENGRLPGLELTATWAAWGNHEARKAQSRLHLPGKDYLVEEEDVMFVRFNV